MARSCLLQMQRLRACSGSLPRCSLAVPRGATHVFARQISVSLSECGNPRRHEDYKWPHSACVLSVLLHPRMCSVLLLLFSAVLSAVCLFSRVESCRRVVCRPSLCCSGVCGQVTVGTQRGEEQGRRGRPTVWCGEGEAHPRRLLSASRGQTDATPTSAYHAAAQQRRSHRGHSTAHAHTLHWHRTHTEMHRPRGTPRERSADSTDR